jgi:hypothetical protein
MVSNESVNPITVLVCELPDEFSLGSSISFSKSMHSVQCSLNVCHIASESLLIQTTKMLPVPGELLFRVTAGHVTLLRPKRPADAPYVHPLNVADFKGIRAG